MTAPLVSFVLLAFNQEGFVEEAIRGALAQDYPNLEVVLSDDASADGTYAVMERAAATYTGPHRIVLNRTGGGGGTLAHLLEAAIRSTGELIVVGAGDDVSYPHRVSRLVEEWQRTGAAALFSGFHQIGDDGQRLSPDAAFPRSDYDPSPFFPHSGARQIAGASAAYDRRLLDALLTPVTPVLAEDYFLSLVTAWSMGTVAAVAEPLLAYRIHAQALTSAGENLLGVEPFERKSAQSAERARDILRLFESLVRSGRGWRIPPPALAQVDTDRLRRDIEYLDYRARWMDMPVGRRILSALSFHDPAQLRWLLPRLFGPRLLAALKRN